METIHRTKLGTFYVYEKKEADEKGIKYTYWMDLKEPGWFITDDEWVAKCYRVVEYEKFRKLYTAIGPLVKNTTVSNERHPKLSFIELARKGVWYNTNGTDWVTRSLGLKRIKKALRLLAWQRAIGMENLDEVAQIAFPKDRIPIASLKRLLRQEKTKQVLKDEIAAMLKERGVDEDYVILLLKTAANMAEEKMDPANIIKVAQEFKKMLDMEPEKVRTVEQIHYSEERTKQLENKIENEHRQIMARRERSSASQGDRGELSDGGEGDTRE